MNVLVSDVLSAAATEHTNACFASCRGKELTFVDLDTYSDELASELRGLGRQILVGILSRNCLEYLVCYFAIIKSGNIVVPLNPAGAATEAPKVVMKGDIKFLFVESRLMQAMDAYDIGDLIRIDLGDDFKQLPAKVNRELEHAGTRVGASRKHCQTALSGAPADIAQIIFTSGTKGHASGVCLTHQNLIANMEQIVDRVSVSRFDNMLVILPFHYSFGNSLILSYLSQGARLTLNQNSLLPKFIIDDLINHKCTAIAGVASSFILLLRRSNLKSASLPHLRSVLLAGEAVPEWVVGEFKEMQLSTYVMYGQTEATARISILRPEEIDIKPTSVGRPVAGLTLKIVDAGGKALAPNQIGEVVVAGANIMLGYWNDEESTKSKIKSGYLHTGDLGHLDEDGFLYISGRVDDMIKIGGERVFPIEIEKVLLEHEQVSEAAVAGIKDVAEGESFSDYMGSSILAAIVPMGRIDTKDVLAYCASKLPRHKVPAKIVFVDELPKTDTGKLKRGLLGEASNRAIPKRDLRLEPLASHHLLPWANLWRDYWKERDSVTRVHDPAYYGYKYLDNDYMSAFVCLEDTLPIGFCGVFNESRFGQSQKIAHFSDFIIVPEQRGKGYLTRFLDLLFDQLQDCRKYVFHPIDRNAFRTWRLSLPGIENVQEMRRWYISLTYESPDLDRLVFAPLMGVRTDLLNLSEHAGFFEWRYLTHPENHECIVLKEDGAQVGYFAFKLVATEELSVAEIVGLRLENSSMGERLKEIFQYLRKRGANYAILKTSSGSGYDDFLQAWDVSEKTFELKYAIELRGSDCAQHNLPESMLTLVGEDLDVPREYRLPLPLV